MDRRFFCLIELSFKYLRYPFLFAPSLLRIRQSFTGVSRLSSRRLFSIFTRRLPPPRYFCVTDVTIADDWPKGPCEE